MSADDAMAARAAGKARVAHRIVWALTLGRLELRCLKYDLYEVEANSSKGWARVVTGTNALELLKQAVSLPLAQDELAKKIAQLDEEDLPPRA